MAYKAAKDRGEEDATELNTILGSSNGGPPLIQTVVDAISDEEWMSQVLAWHDSENREERTLRFPKDFKENPSPLHA